MIENIPTDPENTEELLAEKETTRMSVIHMALTAGVIIAIIIAIVVLAIFSPTEIGTRFREMFPSPAPKTEEAVVEPTATPEPTADQPMVGTASPSPKSTASPSPMITSTPVPSVIPSPTPITQTITAPAGQDGNVTDTGYVNAMGYIDVGRTPDYLYRGFVGFNLSEIPATAKISKATLRLYQRTLAGTPQSILGDLLVDHLDSGTTLTADSFAGGTIYELSFGAIDTDRYGEWKVVNVTSQVRRDREIHTSSQFRLHFRNETKGGSNPGDIASFSSSNNGSEAPQLVVEYN